MLGGRCFLGSEEALFVFGDFFHVVVGLFLFWWWVDSGACLCVRCFGGVWG